MAEIKIVIQVLIAVIRVVLSSLVSSSCVLNWLYFVISDLARSQDIARELEERMQLAEQERRSLEEASRRAEEARRQAVEAAYQEKEERERKVLIIVNINFINIL